MLDIYTIEALNTETIDTLNKEKSEIKSYLIERKHELILKIGITRQFIREDIQSAENCLNNIVTVIKTKQNETHYNHSKT